MSWRVLDRRKDSGGIAIDLLISRQTYQLDGDPTAVVTTEIPNAEMLLLDPDKQEGLTLLADSDQPAALPLGSLPEQTAVLLRSRETSLSIVQAMQTVDLQSISVRPGDNTRTAVCKSVLFRERLEKGVVRRARIRVAICPHISAVACLKTETPEW